MNILLITHTVGSRHGVQRGGGGQLLTMMMITSMTRNHYFSGSMVIPGVEFPYMSPPIIRGGIIGVGKRLNNCFKASARSAGKRRRMCVRNARTQMLS